MLPINLKGVLGKRYVATSCSRIATKYLSTSTVNAESKKVYNIGLIPADGIGKEIMPAAVKVIEALETPVNWISLKAGFELFQRTGTSLPEQTVESLKNDCDAALFGAVSSPSHKVNGYSSPIVALRKKLDLYANVRPMVSSPIPTSMQGVDCVIVRENTECLYVKKEHIETLPDGTKKAIAQRIITENASKRIGKLAYHLALKRSAHMQRPGKVTIVHKSNVLSISDGLFRESVLQIAKESELNTIQTEEQLVDSCVYRLFVDPQSFDVVVAPNMYGDIVSDGAAAVVGGLGIVPSCNMSDSFVLAEPVHGSAPDIVGKGIANPIAMIRCAGLVLEHLGETERASAIEKAVQDIMQDSSSCTPDLKGTATTMQVADSIAEKAYQYYKGFV